MNHKLKLERARDFLFSRHPFYGCLAMNLPDRIVSDPDHPTACTDGAEIRWHPEWLESLTDEETRYILAEETMHCAHGHLWRIPCDREGNMAADYEIRETLKGLDGLSMPAGLAALPDVYPDKSAEEIYRILKKQKQEKPGKPDDDKPGTGDFTAPAPDAPAKPGNTPGNAPGSAPAGNTPADPSQASGGIPSPSSVSLEEKWKGIVEHAGQCAAAGVGELPGGLSRILKERHRVKVDWRAETAAFLKSALGTRADYRRSARRMATAPVIYPRKRADNVETVVVVRDTSGSISGPILEAFNGCIETLAEELQCAILLIDCDAEINAMHEVPHGTPFPDEAQGGGGTDFRPPFAEIARRMEAGETFAGLIYLTDLEGPEPKADAMPVETLWLCITDRTAKHGRTVRIEAGTY